MITTEENKLLRAFKKAERDALPWYSFRNVGVLSKIRRIFFLRTKYLVFSLYRFGLIKNVTAELFFGKKIRLPLGDPNALKMYFLGTLGAPRERGLTAFFITHLKEDDVFYDIGANFGFYTFLGNEIIQKGEVHSFEPNPRVTPFLKENSAGSNIVVNDVAVSDVEGITTLLDCTEDSSSGSVVAQINTKKDKRKRIDVTTIILDTYIINHTPPTVMKIDIEGAEMLALRGALSLIKKYKPTIALEVWGGDRGEEHHAKAVKFLNDLEYTPFRINEDGELFPASAVNFSNINRYENFVFKSKNHV